MGGIPAGEAFQSDQSGAQILRTPSHQNQFAQSFPAMLSLSTSHSYSSFSALLVSSSSSRRPISLISSQSQLNSVTSSPLIRSSLIIPFRLSSDHLISFHAAISSPLMLPTILSHCHVSFQELTFWYKEKETDKDNENEKQK